MSLQVNNITKTPQSTQIKPEKTFMQRYTIFTDDVLGSGHFGKVYFAVRLGSRRQFAVKHIEMHRFNEIDKKQLKIELLIVQTLTHPGVVRVAEVHETPVETFIVMEKMFGDLFDLIIEEGQLAERRTRFIMAQLLVAVRYLHSLRLVHCDLKPENVLVSGFTEFPQTKICDFGLAKVIKEGELGRVSCGTFDYVAPEIREFQGYDLSADMWSLGVVAYICLSGTMPFSKGVSIAQRLADKRAMYPDRIWEDITSTATNFIDSLLQVDRRKRPTAGDALLHNWMRCAQLESDLRSLETRVGARYLTVDPMC